MTPPDDIDVAVAHLYGAAAAAMRRYGIPFIPLETVADVLGWDDATMGAVVDACIAGEPVAFGELTAEWLDDGDRRAFGAHRTRFIGVRRAAPGVAAGQTEEPRP